MVIAFLLSPFGLPAVAGWLVRMLDGAGGVNTFYTGMALGVDQWAASIVLDMKKDYPSIQLVAVLPCETQANNWSVQQRERYFDELLPKCDEVITLNTHYTRSCMFERNRYLVDHADYLLAVYDGGGKGGTAYTVNYGKQKHRQITSIHPDTLAVTSSTDIETLRLRSQFTIVKGKDE